MQFGSEKKALVFYCALAAISIFLTVGSNARGDIIRVDLHGEVTSVVDPAGLLGGQINVYDEITGFYRFDTSTLDTNPLITEGDYQQASAGCGISLNINGMLFASVTENMDFLIRVINDTDSEDGYFMSSTLNVPTNGLMVNSIRWQLEDGTGTALSSDALVAVTPWQWGGNILEITFRGVGGGGRIEAFITDTEIVPEPASALMFSVGALFIGLRRKRLSS
jgi:hypothetical protein